MYREQKNLYLLSLKMINLPYLDKEGKVEVSPKASSLKLNPQLISQVLYCLKWRGTAKPGRSKTRSLVRGGGRKPWKQKGTGRARAGSIRSPLFTGGGVTFGPSGEKALKRIPLKMKKLAFAQLMVKKISSKEAHVLSSLTVKDNKTKQAVEKFKDLTQDILLVVDKKQVAQIIPFRNIHFVTPVLYEMINPEDIISNKHFVFTEESVIKLKSDLES